MEPAQSDLRESILVERAADLGFGRQSSWLLPIVLTDPEFAVTDERQSAVDLQVWKSVRDRLARASISSLSGFLGAGREMAIVVGMRSESDRDATAKMVASVVGVADTRPTVIAVGPAARQWRDLRDCLSEARETAIAARSAPYRPWHDATAPDVDRLLWSLKDSPQVRAFVRRRIGTVLDHDSAYGTHLLDTLAAICEHGGNITETAAALFVRRQSLYKRLQKLEALLGGPVTSTDVRLGVELALRLRKYM
jgi:purine catabolism regulator